MSSMEYIEKKIREWHEINVPVGRKFGYPECCIKEFCEQPPEMLKNRQPTMEDQVRLNAAYMDGNYTGFIPCYAHAKEIKYGKLTLDSLITNRDKDLFPFPIDW